MNKISESHLRSLGFQKEVVPIEESGSEVEFYYYSLDVNYLTLITDGDDEIIDNQWSVHIMESGLEKIYDLDDLVKLIHLLKKYEIK
jgi:hypothetical protein